MRQSFDRVRDGLWGLLPRPLDRWIPATAIGYVMINLTTFATDIGLLTVAFRLAHLPYPVSVTIGYGTALVLGYLLNRALNFESHAAVGGELVRYVLVMALNYALLVVGFSWLLQRLGVQFQAARVAAACVEAVFVYCALRWFVFRSAPQAGTGR